MSSTANTMFCHSVLLLRTGSGEEDLGSSEESGKDWDELEEEAKQGCAGFFSKFRRFLTESYMLGAISSRFGVRPCVTYCASIVSVLGL